MNILASVTLFQITTSPGGRNNMAEFNGFKISDITILSDNQRRIEFEELISTISLLKDEDYDCTKINVWSYRK